MTARRPPILIVKPLLLFGFLMGFACTVWGQAAIKSNQLKFSPLKIVDLVNPGIEISYERLYAKRHSSQITIGRMLETFNTSAFEDYSGWRAAIEQKYFLQKQADRRYVSAEFAFLHVDYVDASNFSKDTSLNSPTYLDTFGVARKTYTLNFKYGIQVPYKRFILDISAGLGIKFKRVSRLDVNDRNAFERGPVHPNAYFMANKEGSYFSLNVPIVLRVGYQF